MCADFKETSYELHRRQYETQDAAFGKTWGEKDTVDYWRHERMYRTIDPILSSYADSTWLTIGDGRYGTDANYILSKGVANVIATDIAETYLKIAKENGFINEYKLENAEKMSFADGSMDFILCKEAYHHFPRPMIALYEMLRVARKGVVLIEPQDPVVAPYQKFIQNALNELIGAGKRVIKKLLRKETYYEYGRYEPVGNYVYTISEREIEKVALGLNYDLVAFKGINDYYEEGVETEKNTATSSLYKKVKKEIEIADERVKQGKAVASLLTAIIFKTMPSPDCLQKLEEAEFRVKRLPKNPYI